MPIETANYFRTPVGKLKDQVVSFQGRYAQWMTEADANLTLEQLNAHVEDIDVANSELSGIMSSYKNGFGFKKIFDQP